MFIVVKDQRGKPIPECAVRLITVGLTNPDGSNQSEYRHTDEGGNCAWTWYPRDVAQGYILEVNNGVQNDKPQFDRPSRHVTQAELEGGQQLFTLQDVGGGTQPGPTPPGGGFNALDHSRVNIFQTAREWFDGLVRQHGLSTITSEALATLEPDLAAKGILWQRTSGNARRPRMHFPPADANQFERNIDVGDFPGNGPHNTFGVVWEVRGWPDRWQ
jgi:hypothetical protein